MSPCFTGLTHYVFRIQCKAVLTLQPEEEKMYKEIKRIILLTQFVIMMSPYTLLKLGTAFRLVSRKESALISQYSIEYCPTQWVLLANSISVSRHISV